MDGIAQWWLNLTPDSVGLVERALEVLREAGVVVGARAPDGRIHYRRRVPDAPADAAAIEAALDRLCAAPPALPPGGRARPPPRP
ncbi:hypothetical protein [Paraburkholderia unamae]|uniref:hypothetical protein n=1 Tax=Paraburkholderia unamae TaxID=219649 RepID=UPI000DD3FA3F|nr:hypothetical protein [Paraburkholderia unamae]